MRKKICNRFKGGQERNVDWAQPSALWQPQEVGCVGLEGGYICTPVADSCWHMAETTTIW